MRRSLPLLLLLLAAVPEARAGREDVEGAIRVVAARDDAAVERLANAGGDEVWKLVTALCARGDLDAAQAVARRARRKQDDRLLGHVEAWRAWGGDRGASRAAYERVAAAEQAFREGRLQEAHELAAGVPFPAGAPPALEARAALLSMLTAQGLGRGEESLEQGMRAARIARELGWWWRESMVLGPLLAVLLSANRLRDAEPWARRAVENAREIGDDGGIAFAEGRLGGILARTYRFPEAVEAYRRAAAWYDARPPTEWPAELYHGLGAVLLTTGDLFGAVGALEKARRNPTPDDPGLHVEVLLTLAESLDQLGRPGAAAALYEEARKAVDALGDPRQKVRRLLGLAKLDRARGAFASAIDGYERALALARTSGDAAAVAAAAGGLAAMLQAVGDIEGAARLAREAIGSAGPGEVSPAAVTLRGILAGIDRERGDLPAARRGYEAMRELAVALADAPRQGVALAGLGVVADREGRAEEASRLLEQAASLARTRGDVAGEAAALALGGESLARAGRLAEADARLSSSEALAEEIGAAEIAAYARAARASAHLRRGDAESALRLAREGAAAATGLGRLQSDERTALLGQEWAEVFETGAAAALALGRGEEALELVEQGRAVALRRALGAGDAMAAPVVPPALAEEVGAARALLDAAVRARLALPPDTPRSALVAPLQAILAARERLGRAEDRVQAAFLAARPLLASAVPREALPRVAPAGTAIVVYARLRGAWVAFVIQAGAIRAVPLGAIARLADAVEAVRKALGDPEAGHAAAESLRAEIVAPLGLPADLRRVVIAPDGDLWAVPWRLLLPDREVALVPSATVLSLLAARREAGGTRVLAFGGVDLAGLDPARSGGLLGPTDRLEDLPASRVEAQAVADETLLESEASEAAFHRLVAGGSDVPPWRAVHFACHGLLDDRRPRFSALVLAPSAGADGFLTHAEIAASRVRADLVTLSACDTARGRVYRGEGLVGLSQAFLVAGAPRVIASLWKVPDDATAALMTEFYRLWRPKDGSRGLAAAAALARAQDHVRAKPRWKAPHAWAAWVLWGLAD